MQVEFFKWLLSAVLASSAAFLGAYIGLGKYKKEKVWDAKNQAYQNILNALNEIRFWASENLSGNVGLPVVGSKTSEELRKSYTSAKEQLEKYAYIGELVVSDDAYAVIRKVMHEISAEDFRFEDEGGDESSYQDMFIKHCEKIGKIVEENMRQLISCARADLK